MAVAFGACMGRTRADGDAQVSVVAPVSAATAAPTAGASVTESKPSAAPASAAPATVGHLERPSALQGFFSRLARLEARDATGDVRVLQLGDSHTASDYGTSVLREQLVARFGDGGRGFIPIGKPYKRLFQAGELVSDGVDFDPEEGKVVHGGLVGDGCYGPSGIAMIASKSGARVYSTYSTKATSLEIAYAEAPRGGSFDVIVDGAKLARIETRKDARAAAFRAFDVSDAPHRVELRANGDGEVRVFGVALDVAARGVTLDALGVNGAKASTPLTWDPRHTAEQIAHRAPALVIFAYGTNECGDATTPEQHEQNIVELARRVRAGAPEVSCLVLGPPDRASGSGRAWTTMPKLDALIAAQRRAASAAGCAFFDQLAAMGGPGSIDAWSREAKPRARGDHVHLTRSGYATLATALAGDLLKAYDAWKGALPRAPTP